MNEICIIIAAAMAHYPRRSLSSMFRFFAANIILAHICMNKHPIYYQPFGMTNDTFFLLVVSYAELYLCNKQ